MDANILQKKVPSAAEEENNGCDINKIVSKSVTQFRKYFEATSITEKVQKL